MCFSAHASFIGSGLLFIIGSLTLLKVKNKSQLPVALIPYFFSIQQFSEGILWLILTNNILLGFSQIAMYTFLFFAFIFWPLWMPFSLYQIETHKKEKHLLIITFIIGLFVAGINSFYLIFYGAKATILSHHICYDINLESSIPTNLALLVYCIATVLPLFISSVKYVRQFAILITASLIIAYVAYIKFFTSVWCFFAAILSILVYWIINNLNKNIKN